MNLVTTIRDLHRRKGRERRGLALAEGVRLVEEMVGAAVDCKGAVISPALEATPRGSALAAALRNHGVRIETIGDRELGELAATEHPQGIVAVYQPREWALEQMLPTPGRPLVVLDGVQDPGNVGTIARTALAFGGSGMVALPGTVDLANPKVVRSAAGALFVLPSLHADSAQLLELLRRQRIPLWATAMDGEPLGAPPDTPVALLLGNEGAGIQADLLAAAARRVAIPIRAEAESLNVAVAAGILLHHLGSA